MVEKYPPTEVEIFSVPIATTHQYKDFFLNGLTPEERGSICERLSSMIVEITDDIMNGVK